MVVVTVLVVDAVDRMQVPQSEGHSSRIAEPTKSSVHSVGSPSVSHCGGSGRPLHTPDVDGVVAVVVVVVAVAVVVVVIVVAVAVVAVVVVVIVVAVAVVWLVAAAVPAGHTPHRTGQLR